MPVGTQATVKAQQTQALEDAGSQILLANTYHLLLRPGTEVFRSFGGIHKFMSWPRSVLTDSGGFQIFSLPHSRSMGEDGAVFQSYLDGRSILLSPEVSIETQKAIGSDIMMVLDQCIPSTADESAARAALGITHRWAARSLAARGDSPQSLFAIVQGALFRELRRESAATLCEMPFDGFAIGGLAVGESKEEREEFCEFTANLLPVNKPRYLMGVGTPLDILEAVHRGVDMFDCIIPTQVAQRGGVFTSRGYLQLRRGVYRLSDEPLDPNCPCPTCIRYSRGYLHHLTKTKETLGWQLLGQHNIFFYHQLMREIRSSIFEDRFLSLYHEKREFLHADDFDNPVQFSKPKRRRPMNIGAYEVLKSAGGFHSIRHVSSGEVMHSKTPPIEEAERLYIDQSNLAQRLCLVGAETAETAQPLIIWDIGLGAGANAMAAIRCYENLAESQPVRGLKIVSFENDLDSLRLAFTHEDLFPYLRHGGPAGILREGRWVSKKHASLQWTLELGDFRETIQKAFGPPDFIFFDMFSSKTSGETWTVAVFQQLFNLCAGHKTEFFTYSCSTPVRAALLSVGFYVAIGRSTGEKLETTIALTSPESFHGRDLLSTDWFNKWKRSGAKYPADIPVEKQADFEKLIHAHPQYPAGIAVIQLLRG